MFQMSKAFSEVSIVAKMANARPKIVHTRHHTSWATTSVNKKDQGRAFAVTLLKALATSQ